MAPEKSFAQGPTGENMPEQGALMEFLRGRSAETTVDTLNETEIRTPVSRSEKLAMLVWQIQATLSEPDSEDGVRNTVDASLTEDTQTAIQLLSRDGTINAWQRALEFGRVQGTLSEFGMFVESVNLLQYYAPPFLYAKDAMFLQVQGTGNTGLKAVEVKVGYTLERVPDSLFIAALVE